MCFSVVNPTSFKNIRQKWIPEIQANCAGVPIILVGTQIDLRNNPVTLEKLSKYCVRPITYEQGHNLAKELKCVKYVECSALTQKGLKNVFDEAILVALGCSDKSKKNCVLL